MRNSPHRHIVELALAASLLVAFGCAGGEPVTPEALSAARRTWDRAGIRDYDLEWTNSGAMTGHYRVSVRGGQVRRIDSVQPDGREHEIHPGKPLFYGVEGLFLTIEDDLAQLQADKPFGQPKGTTAVFRFTPDPKLGYPRSYRRDVLGTPQGVAIDVLRLDPNPPASPPPPTD